MFTNFVVKEYAINTDLGKDSRCNNSLGKHSSTERFFIKCKKRAINKADFAYNWFYYLYSAFSDIWDNIFYVSVYVHISLSLSVY